MTRARAALALGLLGVGRAASCPDFAGAACENAACAGGCEDYPGWVQEHSTHDCAMFASNWCDGCGYTSSHEPTGTHGLYAHEACCACGGGRHVGEPTSDGRSANSTGEARR